MAKKSQTPKLKECPNCQADWTDDEIEYQQCDSCGYPMNDTKQDSFDEAAFDDDEDDDLLPY